MCVCASCLYSACVFALSFTPPRSVACTTRDTWERVSIKSNLLRRHTSQKRCSRCEALGHRQHLRTSPPLGPRAKVVTRSYTHEMTHLIQILGRSAAPAPQEVQHESKVLDVMSTVADVLCPTAACVRTWTPAPDRSDPRGRKQRCVAWENRGERDAGQG